jgi:Ca-activated chloride channel homolog
MTPDDENLYALKNLTIPPASAEAEIAAHHAAMQAFDSEKNKNSQFSQGKSKSVRLMEAIMQTIGRISMNSPWTKGLVTASVLAAALGTTTILYQQQLRQSPTQDAAYSDNGVVYQQHASDIASAPAPASPPPPAMPAPEMQKAYRARSDYMASAPAAPAIMFEMQDSFSPPAYQNTGRDQFTDIKTNAVKQVATEPVSTFSIDVDTASYAFVRRMLNQGVLPQKDAVRVEEMVNYFHYNYSSSDDAAQPFTPTVAVYPTPWNAKSKIMHIGIKGMEVQNKEKPRSNLVFLLDVSGSMEEPTKLPLLKSAFKLMVENLDKDDTVSIVTYAGNAGTVLEPTKVSDKQKILNAIDSLTPGGATAGAQGIEQAYALAAANYDKKGINRVILATDGDFNVGISDPGELKGYVERKRESGIFLSVLGFGQGNYNDALMQELAQNGNGNAAYIDTLNEARKVLVDEAGSTLIPIAKDVKIQVEFNPAAVAEYRLIGYETRMLNQEDFNNDKIDAGDIGSGHTVTALYEITPKGSDGALIDDSRYSEPKSGKADSSNEYAFLKMRYKLPNEEKSRKLELAITPELEKDRIGAESDDIRFAAAVAAFGQILRGGEYTGGYDYDDVIELAKGAKGEDEYGYRAEFLNLVRLAKSAKGM